MPQPSRPFFRLSRNTTLSAGTSFSLSSLITPNTTGVDTEFIVQSDITGPGISDLLRVSTSQSVQVGRVVEAVATFSYLLESDAGSYNCLAVLSSPGSLVETSNAAVSVPQDINIGRKSLAV